MTYPPQGPYGQQPDPYGQQQPQGYPQQLPGGQYGGYDPNAQYGGGYQQYGGLGEPPEPPKSKTGPIIAIVAIVVLLLGGLGITGFVAPGFFLSDKEDSNNAGSGDETSEKSSEKKSDSGSQEFIDELVTAADEQDKSALRTMKCSDATSTVNSAINAIDNIDGAELGDIKDESDDEVQFIITISYEGKSEDDTVTIKKDGGDWCWQDIEAGESTGDDDATEDEPTATRPTTSSEPDDGGGATGDSEGEQFVQSFLDKLNGGDGAGAAALSCSDSTSQEDITEAAAQGAELEMDPAGTTADTAYVGADLKGTLKGEPVTGRTSAFVEDGKWCIYTFFAS